VAGAKSQARTKRTGKPGKSAARAPLSKKSAKTPKPSARPAPKPASRARAPSPSPAAPRPPVATIVPAPAAPRPRLTPGVDTVSDRLHQVAVVATDLNAAVDFYAGVLGLPFITRFDPPGLAFFDLGGGVRLLLSATASSATLYFHVKDIDAAHKALSRRGVQFLHKPALLHRDDAGHFGKKGVEEWMAFFKDPSGNVLALVARK
jgi:catechol 2,3-dioxygenase-like lactoylglutathione lyase family enzyme